MTSLENPKIASGAQDVSLLETHPLPKIDNTIKSKNDVANVS